MDPDTAQRIEAAFAKGKIEMWELFEVRISVHSTMMIVTLT